MIIHRGSRRMFLTGAGTTLAMPFLSSLLPREANAQAAPAPATRYVQVLDNIGAVRASSMPPMNMSPTQSIGSFAASRPLQDYISANGSISTIYGSWWNSVAPKINLVTNYHAYTATRDVHNISHATCACGHMGPDNSLSDVEQVTFPYSIDWVIEQAFQAADPRAVSAVRMNFSPHFKYGSGNSFGFGGQPVVLPALQNFAQLSSKLVTTTGPMQNAAALQRRDFFNALMDDYRKVSMHPRLSSADKQRFSTYVDSINGIAMRAANAAGPTQCNVAATQDDANLRVENDNALELIANALACGVTRVASYVILAGSDTSQDLEAFHPLHHNDRPSTDALITWRSQRVATFVQALDTFKDETGQSLLDDTVFYWGHEFANCQDGHYDPYLGQNLGAGAHDSTGYTCILGGKASGRMQTGLHVDAGHAPIGRILITAMKAAGLTTGQIEQGGVVGFGEYTTKPPDIVGAFGSAVCDRFLDDAAKRQALPIVVGA
jgi:hypothetical protein